MRRVFNGVARGLMVVSVIGALAMPAEARPRDREQTPVLKIIRKFVVRLLGDGLIDPKPAPVTTNGDGLTDPWPVH